MALANPLLSAVQGAIPTPDAGNDAAGMNAAIQAGQQSEDNIGAALQQAAAVRTLAVTSGRQSPTDDMAPFAYDPNNQTFYAMGRPMDKDFTLYKGALQNADQLKPFSAPAGTIPLTKDQFASAVQTMDDNRSLPVKALAGHSVMNALRSIPGGIAGMLGSAYNSAVAGQRAQGHTTAANLLSSIGRSLLDVQQDYDDKNQQADQAFQKDLTPEQQAAMSATYGQHPLSALGRDVTSIGSSAVPGVAAFALNPALGIAAFGGQGGDVSHAMAKSNIMTALAQVPDAQLAQQNSDYAAMRRQGISEQSAKEQLAEHGAQTAEMTGGTISAAIAPFMGQLGLGVLGKASGLIGTAIPQRLAGNMLTRALVTGGENAALQEGTSDIAQAAGAASAGPGAGSTNPAQYFNLQNALTTGAFGSLLGAVMHGPKVQTRGEQPKAPVANTDIGAATTAAAPDQTSQPSPEAAAAKAAGPQQPQLPLNQPPQPIAPMHTGMAAQGELFPGQPGGPNTAPPPQAPHPQQMPLPLGGQGAPASQGAPPAQGQLPLIQGGMNPEAALASAQQHFQYVQQMLTQRWKSEKAANKTTSGKMLLQERQQLAQQIDALQKQVQPTAPPPGTAPTAPEPAGPVGPVAGEPTAPPPGQMPDGRPPGVAPQPLPNPEPMTPQEAQSRAQVQAERGTPAPEPAPQVSPSTPEPAQDIHAQVAAMLDPASSKDAVFVATGNESAIPAVLPKDVMVAKRPEGVLLTTNRVKANQFRTGALNDAKMAKILGYPQAKGPAMAGRAPAVVEGRDNAGNVVAQSLADAEHAPEAAQAVAQQLPGDGGTVATTTAPAAQARRAALARADEAASAQSATKAAATIARVKGARSDSPKEGSGPLGDLDAPPDHELLAQQAEAATDPDQRASLSQQAAAARARLDERTLAAENAKRAQLGMDPLGPGDNGRPEDMVLAREPLDGSELRTLGDRLQEQARYEANDPQWTEARSTIRRMMPDLGLDTSGDVKPFIKELADADPAQMRALLKANLARIADSTLAKQIVRGKDEVANATRPGAPSPIDDARMALHAQTAETPDKVQTTPSGRVWTYGNDVSMRDMAIVDQWVKLLESQSGKMFPDKIEMMSREGMAQRYGHLPDVQQSLKPTVRGLAGTFKDEQGTTHPIIMVDSARLNGPERIEAMAHEFGHWVDYSIFDRLQPSEKQDIVNDYHQWLEQHSGGTANEAMYARMPPIMAERLRRAGGNNSSILYGTNFREWMADGVARWLLTERTPMNAVERFFAQAAQAIKAFYNTLVSHKYLPPQSLRDFLNDWTGSARVAEPSMSLRPLSPVELDIGGEEASEPTSGDNTKARVAAAALKSTVRPVVDTGARIAQIASTFMGGDRAEAKALAGSLVSDFNASKAGELVRKGGLNVSNLRTIVNKYEKAIDGLRQWHDAQLAQQNDAKRAMEPMSRAMERALQLPRDAQDLLQRTMYEATVNDVHPDVPFDDTRNAHLASDDEATAAANQQRHARVAQLYAQLKAKGGDVAYQRLRDAYGEIHAQTLDNVRRNIAESDHLSDAQKEDALKRIEAAANETRKGAYFPLAREGNWVTAAHTPAELVKDADGKDTFDTREEAAAVAKRYKANNPHAQMSIDKGDDGYTVHGIEKAVYFHSTLAEANAARPGIEAELRDVYKRNGLDYDQAQEALGEPIVGAPYEKVNFYNELKQVPSQFMDRVNAMAKSGAIDPMVHQLFTEMYLESLPELSYRKSALTRENIRGASQDMLKAYARRATGAAHHYALSNHASDIQDGWQQMMASRTKNAAQHPEIGGVLNYLHRGQELLAKRTQSSLTNTTLNVLQDASMLMSLGLQPAFLLVQGVQPALAGLPVLAGLTHPKTGRGVGMAMAGNYIREAYDGAGSYFGKRGAQAFATEFKKFLGERSTYDTMSDTMNAVFDKFGANEAEKKTLQYLADRGSLDFAFMNALHDATSSAVRNKWNAMSRMSMAFTQQVEAMNRVVIALATHRLTTRELGMQEGSLAQQRFVDDIVTKTQGDYSRLNAPNVFNRPLPGLILQFKKYTQFMYALFANNIARAVAGKDPIEKREGLRTLGYLMASHASLSGATGLGPIYGAAKGAAAMAAWGLQTAGLEDKKDKWKSIDTLTHEMYKNLGTEMFGKDAGEMTANVIEHGLPSLVGADISDRVGLPLLYDSRYVGTKPTDSEGSVMDKMLSYGMGTSWYNAKRLANGLQQLSNGQYKQGASTMLPGGARALMQAYMLADKGVTDSHGNQVVPRENISLFDVGQQLLGLRPASVNRAYDAQDRVRDTEQAIKASRQQLIDAYRTGSDSDRDALHDKIADYNSTVPSALRITGAQLSNAIKTQGKPSKAQTQIQSMNGE